MNSIKARDNSTSSLEQPEHFFNRDLSLLQFNLRVLELAEDPNTPILERLKYLIIFGTNLDEFFEIRVAGLKQQILFERPLKNPDGLSPQLVLKEISELCHEAVNKQYRLLNEDILPKLKKEKIRFISREQWNEKQTLWVKRYFKEQIAPVLTPIALDLSHPFPKPANKSLNFIIALQGKDAFGRELQFAIVPAPRSLPRVIRLPDSMSQSGDDFIFLSSMIHHHADSLFPGMKTEGCFQFRLTRNSDFLFDEDEVKDLTSALKGRLHDRQFGDGVRLEVADNCPKNLSDFLLDEFHLDESEMYQVNGPVSLGRLFSIAGLDRPNLKFEPFSPSIPPSLLIKTLKKNGENIFDAIRKKDILLHHPYESFSPIISLLSQAAKDPDVLAIKQTLYRTGADSEIVELLAQAARNGKEVTAIVELRARFDEASNLAVASKLQEAGVVVVYGIVGYKTHCKMILIVRKEGNKLKRYVHLGTGNYHTLNAKIYTDYSLMSAHEEITEDIHRIFQQLTGMGRAARLKHVLQAPFTLHARLIIAIERERDNALAGISARIIIKVNALTEKQVIISLYKASQAGVKIDLIVRGICCLKPGIPGLSENIQVKSHVGRFLEHSRVYYFENSGEPIMYCASADWMDRNFFNRVETAFPILDPDLARRIKNEVLTPYLSDCHNTWQLKKTETYERSRSISDTHIPTQQALLNKLCP